MDLTGVQRLSIIASGLQSGVKLLHRWHTVGKFVHQRGTVDQHKLWLGVRRETVQFFSPILKFDLIRILSLYRLELKVLSVWCKKKKTKM